jgi:Ig-like domain from next to BRCA1 gene
MSYSNQTYCMSYVKRIHRGTLLVASVLTIAIGIVACNIPTTPPPVAQHVFVFVGGLNTSMEKCHEGTFDRLIYQYLIKNVKKLANPYPAACTNPGNDYSANKTSMIFFSYQGGKMDTQHGVWIPADYNVCDSVNLFPLAHDIQTFDTMLDNYHAVFPNARFTIVAHSLGGIVALQSVYDYVVNKHNNDIDKVITIDSPLAGILPSGREGKILGAFESAECALGTHSGPVLNDLKALGEVTAEQQNVICTPPLNPIEMKLSKCKAQMLYQSGVGVVTLGNGNDELYCGTGTATQNAAGIENMCNGQILGANDGVLSHFYTLTPDPAEGTLGLGIGHFSILWQEEEDIIRYMLAPVVRIFEPTSGNTNWFGSSGTAIRISATMRCLWGAAVQTHALITLGDNSSYFAGTANANTNPNNVQGNNTLILNEVVNLPTSAHEGSAWLNILAGGSACTYPKEEIDSNLLPQDENNFSGSRFGGQQFFLDGGKLAIGMSGRLYSDKPVRDTITRKPLDYSSMKQNIPGGSFEPDSVQNVAWSHDGTSLAYLVTTGDTFDGANLHSTSDLYIASSALQESHIIKKQLLDAVALTWNTTSDKIAVFNEEEIINGPPVSAPFTPSITIIDVNAPTEVSRVSLPPSANNFQPECGIASSCSSPDARIQWASNGTFLLSYGDVGSTFVTATGQASELETGQMYSMDNASMGTLNTRGTLIAYPIRNENGSVDINIYHPDPTTGNLGYPTILTSFPQGFQYHETLDFSPDETKLGLCADTGVYTIDTQQPGIPNKVIDLSGNQTSPTLVCENLRWFPDSQSIMVQVRRLNGNGGLAGFVTVPLAGSPPHILFSCGLSYITAFQDTERFDCVSGAVFDLQPFIQNHSIPPLPSPPSPNDNAKLVSQNPAVTVPAGQIFTLYFDYENVGNTTWADTNGYQLRCDQFYVKESNCMGNASDGFNGAQVPPMYESIFHLILKAPLVPGTYQTAWSMSHKGKIFGQNHVFVTVTVTA